ncbi:Transporter [Alkalibacterium sp. AK22]|uniref:AEC family transporter n=1 Tax=Alkalibacterium sp. AK22 TaxID=1229520 RepID=UPI00044C93E0|nr:permease [Alkalibacterium sp. AK22]EXJ23201.1 Transporter [Alkalibacterium sp. AK22]
MFAVLIQSFQFLLVIAVAYLFKRGSILKSTDGLILQKIILYLTLPATIVVGFNGVTVEPILFIMVALGLLSNILLITFGGFLWRKKTAPQQALMMFSQAGYNIGNFTIPFVQGFFPAAIPYIGSFDMGNALMLFGGSPVIVDRMTRQDHSSAGYLSRIIKLFKSPSFTAYIFMFLLALLGIVLPDPLVSVFQLFSSGNAFLSMFMVGLYLEITVDRVSLRRVRYLLTVRYLLAVLVAAGFYLLLPLPELVRVSLVLVALAPIGTVSTINMIIYGNPRSFSSFLSSVSIIFSLILMTLSLLLIM